MIKLSTKNWTLDNIEAVFFDKDGTFVDLHYFWGKMTELRAEEIIKRFNLSQEEKNKLCLYLGYDISTKKMLSDGITAMYSRSKIIEIFKSNLENFGITISIKELEEIFDDVSENFYKEIEKYIRPIDEAINFIKKIRNLGIKTAIITSDSIKSTELTLKHYNWEGLFDFVVGRETTTFTKESGEGTKLALEELNVDPNKTVMIGDAPMDYVSAQNAGIKYSILVATGQISEKELRKTSKYTVESLCNIVIE